MLLAQPRRAMKATTGFFFDILLLGAIVSLPFSAYCRDGLSREAGVFDAPARIATVPARPGSDLGQIKCTYYDRFIVQETGTDNPEPAPATIIPRSGDLKAAACANTHAPAAIRLETQGLYLLGKKEAFMFFEAADPLGSVGFKIFDAKSGRLLFVDSKTGEGIQTARADHGQLHFGFMRGINGSCSLVAGKMACWKIIAKEGNIPPSVSAPDAAACAAKYVKEKSPADNPSIVSYEVTVTIQPSGKSMAAASGVSGCEPMP